MFGTTIFLDRRKIAPIGENVFEHILKTILSFSPVLSEVVFKH